MLPLENRERSAALVGLALIGALTSCARETMSPPLTESIILPSQAATVEGNAANFSPFRDKPGRFQTIYGASLLQIPVGATITGMRFRLDSVVARSPSVTISDFEVRLSTSAHPALSMSTTFAANRGADEVIVRTGPLEIRAGDYPVGGHPNGFGPTIEFTRPFVYMGGPLLLEIGVTGVGRMDEGLPVTDDFAPGPAESRSTYTVEGGFDATAAEIGPSRDLIVVEYRFVRP